MTSAEPVVDLYIAAYGDPDAAQHDWDEVKGLAKEHAIDVDGMLLVSRGKGGKIEVKDNANDVSKGLKIGAVAGAVVGLIFPPSIIGGAIIGAAAGGGIGALRGRGKKNEIREDIENVLPENSSGIVVLFKEHSAADVEAALAAADKLTKHEVDADNAESIKMAVASQSDT